MSEAADTRVSETTRSLPTRLSTEERGERANEMAHELQTIEGEEEARKSANSAAKARIDERKAKVKRLALEISTGIVHREVKIRILHLFAVNTYREERMDTGAVIFERALTLQEREPFENPELPFPESVPSDEDEKEEPAEEREPAEDEDEPEEPTEVFDSKGELRLETEKKIKGMKRVRNGRKRQAEEGAE